MSHGYNQNEISQELSMGTNIFKRSYYTVLTLSQPAIFFTTSDILIELFYNVNISARIHPPLKQITPLKS